MRQKIFITKNVGIVDRNRMGVSGNKVVSPTLEKSVLRILVFRV